MAQSTLGDGVFIVGGGPAGLAAAIAARERGFRVTVCDYVRPPIDKACGEGLMPDAVAALSRLGVRIGLDQAYPFRGIRFVEGRTVVEADFPYASAWAFGERYCTTSWYNGPPTWASRCSGELGSMILACEQFIPVAPPTPGGSSEPMGRILICVDQRGSASFTTSGFVSAFAGIFR